MENIVGLKGGRGGDYFSEAWRELSVLIKPVCFVIPLPGQSSRLNHPRHLLGFHAITGHALLDFNIAWPVRAWLVIA